MGGSEGSEHVMDIDAASDASEETTSTTTNQNDAITSPEFEQQTGRREPPFAAPKPRLVSKGFKEGRVYQTKDDPDRMNIKHTTPPFVAAAQERRLAREEAGQEAKADAGEGLSCDPEVTARITVEDLITENGFAKVLYNVLTPEECLELIAMGSDKGWSPALVNVGYAQQFLPDVRDHSRCIVDDIALTDELWSRLANHVPIVSQGRRVRGLNDRLRLLCYHQPGQKFDAHKDGNYTRSKHHRLAGDTSFVTVQVYLNEDFTGGATTFFYGNKDIPYQPLTGSVLVFSQNLLHEGSALETGLKYTLRTDVMYKPRGEE